MNNAGKKQICGCKALHETSKCGSTWVIGWNIINPSISHVEAICCILMIVHNHQMIKAGLHHSASQVCLYPLQGTERTFGCSICASITRRSWSSLQAVDIKPRWAGVRRTFLMAEIHGCSPLSFCWYNSFGVCSSESRSLLTKSSSKKLQTEESSLQIFLPKHALRRSCSTLQYTLRPGWSNQSVMLCMARSMAS